MCRERIEKIPKKWREGQGTGGENAFAANFGDPNLDPPNLAPDIIIRNLIFGAFVRANPCNCNSHVNIPFGFPENNTNCRSGVPVLGSLAKQLPELHPEVLTVKEVKIHTLEVISGRYVFYICPTEICRVPTWEKPSIPSKGPCLSM